MEKTDVGAQVHGKLLYRVSEAAVLLSISRSQGYLMVARGELESIKIGARGIRIPAPALTELVAKGEQR
jgi:excisionase family DNA binding protein